MGKFLPVHFMGHVVGMTLLLFFHFQVVVAHPADRPSLIDSKLIPQSPPVIDNQRYLGLTIFNFETDARIDDERIENSAASGCNAVEITISWDRVYPTITSKPGWGVVDSHVQTAQRLGLKIALRVHVGRDADKLGGFWGVHETMQAADSSRSTNQGIIQFSFSHKPTVERANAFVQEAIARYRYLQEQGQLLFFSVVSSPALESEYSPVYSPPTGSKYVVPYDYSVSELEAFRQYLQARFSLAKLNQRWATSFGVWKDVRPMPNNPADPYASQTGVRGEDWYVFRHRQLKSFIDKINGTVKSVDPNIVVVNQHGCVWDRLSGLRATFAFKDLNQSADGLKFNDGPDYNHRFSMDVVRTNLKPGAFMINAIDGLFHNSVSLDKYYNQISQCYEHGAKMLTLANFGGMDARQKLTDLIKMVVSNGLLNQPVTPVQTAGEVIGYKLSDILKSYSIAQERWGTRYSQNGNKPVRIEIDEDLLRNEPPIINSLPILSKSLTDQSAIVGRPFSYSIGQAFTDPDGMIVSVVASGLPQGIQWSSATGKLTGTPTRLETALVTLTAQDNLGAMVTGSFRITVTDPAATNRPPVAPVLTAQIGQVGQAFSYLMPPYTDPEAQPLIYTLTGIPDGLTYSPATGLVVGTPLTAGTYSVMYTATDPANARTSALFQLTIREATPPVKRSGNFEGYLDKYNCEGDIWGWVWDRNLPNTAMPVEVLDGSKVIGIFTANVLRPDLVAAQKGNGAHGYQFLIPASIKDGLDHKITLRIENSDYNLKGSPMTLNCPISTAQVTDPTSNPPTAIPIPIQNAYTTIPFSYTIPEFPHKAGQTLLYAITGGVAGLTYTQATRTFSGTPNQIGTFTASLIVSDGEGGYTPSLVTVVVGAAPANRPPVIAQALNDQTAVVGQAFNLTIPATVFSDPEGSTVSVAISGLPGGLSFNASSRLISGIPTLTCTFAVTCSGTDPEGATTSLKFNLTVNPAPDVTASYEGYLDKVECGTIRGWVWDRNQPNSAVTIEFYTGSTVWGTTVANIYREDLKTAGKGNGIHAYSFEVPASLKGTGTHVIYGRVKGQSYVLKDSGKSLICPTSTRLSAEPSAEFQIVMLGNPIVGNAAQVEIRGAEGQFIRFQLTDSNGRIWREQSVEVTGEVQRQTVEVGHLPPGHYLLRAMSNIHSATLKVIKH